MTNETEKTTVPIPPVGAGGEQPISKTTTEIIPIASTEINQFEENSEENFEELYRQMQRLSDPAYLHTVSLTELYETKYESRPPVIEVTPKS